MVLVKYKEWMYYCISLCMLVVQACCNTTVCFIQGIPAHFEKVWPPVVVLCEKCLFMELSWSCDRWLGGTVCQLAFFLIVILVFLLICKNNGFWGNDWKKAFESYREEGIRKMEKLKIISICEYLRGLESDKSYKTVRISRCEREWTQTYWRFYFGSGR